MATVAPIQYQVPAAPMGGGLMQGLKLGMTYQQMVAAQQEQAMKQEQMRQAVERQRQTQMALQRSFVKPIDQWTAEDVTTITTGLPEKQLGVFRDFVKQRSEAENGNLAKFYGQTLSAIKVGRPDLAAQMFENRAAAETDPNEQAVLRGLAKVATEAPDAAAKNIVGVLAGSGKFDKNYIETLNTIFKPPAEQGRMISTPADKIKAGLVNDKGEPLPGTFFQEPGKEPKLITGEKPQEEPVEIRTMRQLGLPITPEGYEQFKKRGPALQVNVGGEAKPTAFQQELDKKFAPIAVDWMAGEKSLAASRINQLDAVIKTLDSKKRITGPVLGLTPDIVLAFVNPASREARANAERVIQEGLRATLGSQFTKVEGENFLARAYDPKAPQADNARRLRSIVAQMKASAKDRDAMLKYVEGPGKGSLVGFTGRVPTIADFYAAIDEQPPTQTPTQTPAASLAAPPGFGPRAVSGMVTPAEASPVSTPAVSTRALPNQAAIDFLRRNPSLRGAFDEKYGPGAAARVLGGQ